MTVNERRSEFEADLARAQTSKDHINALIGLAWVHMSSDIKAAADYAQKAVNLAATYTDDALYAESLCRLADAKLELGEREPSLELYQASAEISRRNKDYLSAAKTSARQSIILCELGRYTEALQLNLDGWPALEKHGSLYVQATCLIWIGNITEMIGDVEGALVYFYRAAKILERKKYTSNCAWAYAMICRCMYKLGQESEALEKGCYALRLARDSADLIPESLALGEIAITLARLARASGKLQYQRLARMCAARKLRLTTSIRNEQDYAECKFVIGEVERLCGRPAQAEVMLRETLKEAQLAQQLHLQNYAMLALGQLLLERGTLHESGELLLQVVKSARACEQRGLEQDALQNLMFVSEQRKDYQEALIYSKELLESKQAQHQEQAVRETERLKARFNFDRVREQRDRHALRVRELEVTLDKTKRGQAEMTSLLNQKTEVLQQVEMRIAKMLTRSECGGDVEELQRLAQEIRRNLTNSNVQVFAREYTDVNESYQQILLKRYPQLSLNDLKLCKLLRLQLRTKEIANLLSLTPRTVEVYRSRIRRKLQLPQQTSLTVFLSSIA